MTTTATTKEPIRTSRAVAPDRILQLGLSFWNAKTLLSAVELQLFTLLAQRGTMDAESLRTSLGLHPRSARDFFDALVALGMLQRSAGKYSNTAEADQFLDRRKPTYVGGILEMAGKRLYAFWGNLTEGLRTGQRQNETGGNSDFFGALYADTQRLEEFLSAMTGLSLGAAEAIARKFPWQNYKSFIDVGCAQGGVPVVLAQKHPHLTGGGFDLPAVQPIFEKYVRAHGLADRVKFHAGSFFTDPLPRADVLIMGHILHDWNMEEKKTLLKKAFDALPPGGALIVFEAIIDDDRSANAFGLLMSLNMLIETPGGFDYSGADCIGWMKDVGFVEGRVEHLCGPDSMVIGIKAGGSKPTTGTRPMC